VHNHQFHRHIKWSRIATPSYGRQCGKERTISPETVAREKTKLIPSHPRLALVLTAQVTIIG
jgi:hypothetical protein